MHIASCIMMIICLETVICWIYVLQFNNGNVFNAQVKANIHSNISRLLESMRNREVFLLNQVDVILEAKEERLRGQEDQLNQAIGRLSNCLSLLDGGTSLSTELNDILSRWIDFFLPYHPCSSCSCVPLGSRLWCDGSI